MDSIRSWFRRHFRDPEIVALLALLLGGILLVVFFGRVLAPVIASVVIAYVLDAPMERLRRIGTPRLLALGIVFSGFMAFLLLALLAFLPLLLQQIEQVVRALPGMIGLVQDLLLELPERRPDLIDPVQVEELVARLRNEAVTAAQGVLAYTFAQLGNLVVVGVYLFVVPFMVFFLLKDKDGILTWLERFLPGRRALAARVWADIDRKLGAYVRGKIYEMAIVGVSAWLSFTWLGVDFALLLAVATGLSVLVPYVGVVAVAVPVTLVALFQFGWTSSFGAVVGVYTAIQLIDGNLLAPLLLSEVVDLHPVAVIVAIFVFGGIWGFWGVFFAIPLATVAAAVIEAWPGAPAPEPEPG